MEGATVQRPLARTRERLSIAIGALSVATVAVVAWPIRSIQPAVGIDWDWVGGLYYAAEHSLRFGDRIVWSYGPLGFLNPWFGPALYTSGLFALSWLFAALVQVLLAASLLTALRRWLPVPAAVLVAAFVVVLAPDHVVALGFVWCVLLVTRDGDTAGRFAMALPLALGALVGVSLLGKLNQGFELLLLAGVALVGSGRRRDALACGCALLAAAAIGWVATGQQLADVWPYVRDSVRFVAGYAGGMGNGQTRYDWTYIAALGLSLLALAGAVWHSRRAPGSQRRALFGLVVVYAGLAFKEGFVRQDQAHLYSFFGDMLLPFVVLAAPVLRQRLVQLGGVAVVVAVLVAILGHEVVTSRLDPYANAAAAVDQLRTLASPGRREEFNAGLRQSIAETWQIQPQMIAALGRRTVMFLPYMLGDVAWAYDLRLRPLPTLEAYAAFTPALDRLDARMLASARAPERVLRVHTELIEGHVAAFEGPMAMTAILCNYHEIAVEGQWELLGRAPNRCGAPRVLKTAEARSGAVVPVPAARRPDALVLVRVTGSSAHGLEALRSLLVRPRQSWIELDGQRYSVVGATAADGLLLRAPPGADFTGAFALASNPSHIAYGHDGGQPGEQFRFVFLEIPIGSAAEPVR
ncbi:MAG TPA: hypothetical protein VN635_05320 [Conexibacter sp.]|nr:hypothetical protein [Conexibacter sp.]